MGEIASLAEELLTSEHQLCSMDLLTEWVSELVAWLVGYLVSQSILVYGCFKVLKVYSVKYDEWEENNEAERAWK